MVTGILLYLAFIRLLHSDYHIEGGAMLLTASIAVCANLLYVPVWSRRHGGRRARGAPPGWESWLSPRPDRRATGTHSSHLSPALGLPEDRREGDLESRVSRHLLRAYCVPATLLGAFISTVSFEAHTPPPEVDSSHPSVQIMTQDLRGGQVTCSGVSSRVRI